jgi:hypothetical protein
LFFSCDPVGRMRESTFIFNRFAEDALNSMFAPYSSKFIT